MKYEYGQNTFQMTPFPNFQRNETIRQAFVRLDETIYNLESQCLGPRLATNEAWKEHLLKIEESTNSALDTHQPSLDASIEDVQLAPPAAKEVTSERERLAMVQVCSVLYIEQYFVDEKTQECIYFFIYI